MAATFGTLINQAAAQNGVPVDWMTRILNVENPNLDPNARSYTGVRGLSQITQSTWATVNPGVPYSLDPAAQLSTQAKLLAQYQQNYNGNFALAAAAYNGGPGVANRAQQYMNGGMSQADAINLAASEVYASNPAKVIEINNYVAKATGQSAASLSTLNQATTVAYLTDDSDPAMAQPVFGMAISSDQIASIMTAIAPPLVIDSGIGQPGPLQDNGIVQVNKVTAPVGSPVTFQIQFNAQQTLPITLALNASLQSNDKSMRHVITQQRTRTGMLVDLWGMHPDQISGRGTTGLFMNQLGVTDFLSLSTVSADMQKAVLQGFQSKDMVASDVMESKLSQPGFLRIAAKDTFVEFLSLFKSNGNVWFQNQNYKGYNTGQEQQAVDVWSPETGSTTFQNAARRNEVMTRGRVVMYFRNAAYYGYFKNLSWTMDATKPFQWNFNFVFQVESTAVNVRLPK